MFHLAELQLFIQTAQLGSLTKAAQNLGLLVATASASIKRLERTLECRLFERSTRSMRLTPQGESFLRYARDAVDTLDRGIVLLREGAQNISGLLRISAPSDVGRHVLQPWLDEFQERHPELRVHLQCVDRFVDIFQEPFDMTFRYGRLRDSSYISQTLGANRRVIVASPSYLARHGLPGRIEDLADHNCLIHGLDAGGFNTWRLTDRRRAVQVKVHGNRSSDDGALIHAWAVAGAGIAYKSRLDVHAELANGRLVNLFPHLLGEDWPLRVVYPHRASPSPAARALTGFVREKIAALGNA
ncbi:LysR family transcriptional regulator [Massilia sp. 9I]|uniref:LysR family transcriptional regulator n=1 Tax=Massilia sp. 9I TaxID=2653152 RepID=UPI0012F18682|nr:LysR family transcriptional regulator [Massilia sp. 9I]VXC48165.1 Bacterial regulatory helix-turn-helix, lysR family protein [Massilia sp. 9I]